MKRIPIFFLLAITAAAVACAPVRDVKTAVEDVRAEYAPDKRVAVFDITVNREGRTAVLEGECDLPEAADALENLLNESGIPFENRIRMLPDSDALNGRTRGIVRVAVANLRTGPWYSAEMATQAIMGTPVRVLKKDEENGFYRVQTPDGYLGWMSESSFSFKNDSEFRQWKSSERIIFTADHGYLYEKPDDGSTRITDLVPGAIIKKSGAEWLYYAVSLPDGRSGFVKKSEAELFGEWLESRDPNPENILNTAQRFIGVSYLWGGMSSKLMDCSGFVRTVLFLNGLIMPRDASQQTKEGILLTEDVRKVNEKTPAGSLVFFGRHAADGNPERVWHVGIWMGNGLMIHEAGRVKIESLVPGIDPFNKKRHDTFVRSRNITDAVGTGNIVKIADHKWYIN